MMVPISASAAPRRPTIAVRAVFAAAALLKRSLWRSAVAHMGPKSHVKASEGRLSCLYL